MRPRCCLRNLTFFGINISSSQFPVPSCSSPVATLVASLVVGCGNWQLATGHWQLLLERALRGLSLTLLLRQDFALVNPALHADHAVGRLRFRESPVDVGAQRVQRQTSLEVPLGARDFVSVQAA